MRQRGPVVVHVPAPQAGAARYGRAPDGGVAPIVALHDGEEEEKRDDGDEKGEEERLARLARR